MFEHMVIYEGVYEGVVTHSYKKLLGQTPIIMESVRIIEENPPLQTITPRSMGALESAVNDM